MRTGYQHALLGLIAGSALMWGGSVTIPYTFTADTTAKASEVNANFSVLETAVDGNANDIATNTNDISTNATDIATKQKRVTGTCAVGSAIIEIKADGTVVCDDPSTVAAPIGYNVIYAGGRAWLDRNLGATTVASSWDDTTSTALGNLYQWGRKADGHESRTSASTVINTACSTSDEAPNSDFISTSTSPYNWRTTNSNCSGDAERNFFWSDPGNNTLNGVCPIGWRVPVRRDFEALNIADGPDAYSKIKLVAAGLRNNAGGISSRVSLGFYWTSTANGVTANQLYFNNDSADIRSSNRAYGLSVRCVKDLRN